MRSTDPTFPFYPVMALIGFAVSLIPLPLHLQTWNSGTCAYMFWTSLSCLAKGINSIVWAGNLNNNSPIWCDISSRFFVGAAVGIPASTLCISRRLYTIASRVQGSSSSYPNKRRIIVVDLCIAFGVPILVVVLSYVVQVFRYTIFEDIGCNSAVYNTLAAYFLVNAWPLAMGCISFVYSALALRIFWKRRSQIAQILCSNSSLSVNRYVRLMVVCVADMTFNIPFQIIRLYVSSKQGSLPPWISWDHIHSAISRVVVFPAASWRGDAWFSANVELARWFNVVSAFVFFALFGFGGDVRKLYKDAFQKCLKPFNRVSIFKGVWRKGPQDSFLPSSRKDSNLSQSSRQHQDSTLIGGTDFIEKKYSVDKTRDRNTIPPIYVARGHS